MDDLNKQRIDQAWDYLMDGNFYEAFKCFSAYKKHSSNPQARKILDFTHQNYPIDFFLTIASFCAYKKIVGDKSLGAIKSIQEYKDCHSLLLNSIVHRKEPQFTQDTRLAFFNFIRFDFPKIFEGYLLLEKLRMQEVIPFDISFDSIEQKDIQPESKFPKNTESSSIHTLQSLTGLAEVKKEVAGIISLVKTRQIKQQRNLPVSPSTLHMVFTGNPGTGKTSVARIIANVFKEIGILSKGHLVETDRAGLVAEYVGQTAPKVEAKVKEALGGVLFIDEAYALAPQYQSDFGREAVNTLLPLMENYRDDLVVIMAGYEKDMQLLLDSNDGLRSRIFKTIDFPDYSIDELTSIFINICHDKGYTMRGVDNLLIKQIIEEKIGGDLKAFGNARGVRNLFEQIEVIQASRLEPLLPDVSDDELVEIRQEDINLIRTEFDPYTL